MVGRGGLPWRMLSRMPRLGTERSYGLLDAVSQVAIPREGDLSVLALVRDVQVLDYWKRRCTVARGVWPTHMVETSGPGYPVRPWAEELAELRQQMAILRALAKRYIWSFSGQPIWYLHTPEIEQRYGLKKQTYEGADEAIAGWHAVLLEKTAVEDPKLGRLINAVHSFDQGEIDATELCNRLGTPARWFILGPLTNPFTQRGFSAPKAIFGPFDPDLPVHGRDGVVRWLPFRNYDPSGSVRLMAAFDWFKTHCSSVHLISLVHAPEEAYAELWLGWDDGIAVWLNETLIFDRLEYPELGHGILFRDRYSFEEKVSLTLPKGTSRLAIMCVNQRGNWGVNVRLVGKDGFPLEGLRFSLPGLE